MSRLYALDMGSLCAWQYFAHENEDGAEVDGMLHGLSGWFTHFVQRMSPQYMVACFDAGHARRAAIDPEYKLNRKIKEPPPGYVEQLRKAPELVESLGITCLRFDGEEADDVIASVATQHASPETEVIIVSSDKDLGALVNEHVRQYDPRPDADGNCRFWDVDGVTERIGVPPWRVADYLAMKGDSSDNIAGIVGIGAMYAKAAILQTKSMTELFRKAQRGELANLSKKTQAKIAGGRGQFEHAMKLVELRMDLPVPDLATFCVPKGRAA